MTPRRGPTPQFVKQELNRLNVNFKKAGDSYMMLCCFHRDHKTPSLSIKVEEGGQYPPGTFNCLGCHESGSWNTLAARLGLSLWGKETEQDNFYVDKSIKEIKKEIEDSSLRLSKWDRTWKRYDPAFLRKFQARKLTDSKTGMEYMWLPLNYGGDMQGYIRVRVSEKDQGPKYFFSPRMTKVLFPGDYLLKYQTPVIILVEGIADALRLVRYRMAAASILGTILLPTMKDQLELMGVQTVITCLDGDKAGRRATKGYTLESGKKVTGLIETVEDLGIKAVDFRLPKENDPDDAPVEVLRSLWKLYKKLGGIKLPKWDATV